MSLHRSTSESEESDDQVTWALKRRQVKLTLSPPQHHNCSTHKEHGDGTSDSTHQSQVSYSAELRYEQSSREQEKSEREEECVTPTNVLLHAGSNVSLEVQECTNCTQNEHIEPCINVNSSTVVSDSVLSRTGSKFHCESIHDATATETQQQTDQRGRNHRTESFTLSSELSSFSEGELSPTKLPRSGAACSPFTVTGNSDKADENKKTGTKKNRKKRKSRGGKGGLTGSAQVTDDISSPETARAELAAKQGRKEEGKKKKKKGEKRKEGGQSNNNIAKKSSKMRMRLDSLTTSSDEERVIDSPRLSRVEEVVEPLPVKDERKVVGETGERLRQRLEHKILSKKPPSTFETPATEPLFHKVYIYMYGQCTTYIVHTQAYRIVYA